MASYEAKIDDQTVTITYLQGGTNQVGVKKSARVKAWAICPLTGKKIEETFPSVGDATRAVEKGLKESIEKAREQAAEAPAEA